MAIGTIRLFRSPLLKGEPLYALSGFDQGLYPDGAHKGERMPKRFNIMPTTMKDGRLMWEMMDTEENRAYCEALKPQSKNPPFAYSYEVLEDKKPKDAGNK